MSRVTYKSLDNPTQRVYYGGTDTVNEGYPLCYDFDYGTAASEDVSRRYRVEKPSTTNNQHFAGVVHPTSNAVTGPAWVNIFLPGSTCNLYTDQNCTLNTTLVTAEAGQYRFAEAGYRGRGTARCLQTIDRSSTAGLVLAKLDDGDESGLMETVTPAAGAMTIMVGGMTYFPTTTIDTANATFTLADGTWKGQKKGFFLAGTMTTSDIVVTVTTCYQGGSYDVATMDAVGEYLTAEWNGKAWSVEGSALS